MTTTTSPYLVVATVQVDLEHYEGQEPTQPCDIYTYPADGDHCNKEDQGADYVYLPDTTDGNGFTHDFDILFSLNSDEEDLRKVPVSSIRRAIIETVMNLNDSELRDRVCVAQSFANEAEGE